MGGWELRVVTVCGSLVTGYGSLLRGITSSGYRRGCEPLSQVVPRGLPERRQVPLEVQYVVLTTGFAISVLRQNAGVPRSYETAFLLLALCLPGTLL